MTNMCSIENVKKVLCAFTLRLITYHVSRKGLKKRFCFLNVFPCAITKCIAVRQGKSSLRQSSFAQPSETVFWTFKHRVGKGYVICNESIAETICTFLPC